MIICIVMMNKTAHKYIIYDGIRNIILYCCVDAVISIIHDAHSIEQTLPSCLLLVLAVILLMDLLYIYRIDGNSAPTIPDASSLQCWSYSIHYCPATRKVQATICMRCPR